MFLLTDVVVVDADGVAGCVVIVVVVVAMGETLSGLCKVLTCVAVVCSFTRQARKLWEVV